MALLTYSNKRQQELLHRNSYTKKKTKVFKDTKKEQITQTIQLQKTRPSSSLTADRAGTLVNVVGCFIMRQERMS